MTSGSLSPPQGSFIGPHPPLAPKAPGKWPGPSRPQPMGRSGHRLHPLALANGMQQLVHEDVGQLAVVVGPGRRWPTKTLANKLWWLVHEDVGQQVTVAGQ